MTGPPGDWYKRSSGTPVKKTRAWAGVEVGVMVAVGRKVAVAVDVNVAVAVAVNVVVGDGPGVNVKVGEGVLVAVGGIKGSNRSVKI
jgi:hypothetical protein